MNNKILSKIKIAVNKYSDYLVWLCTVHRCFGFIHQGTVTELKIEEK